VWLALVVPAVVVIDLADVIQLGFVVPLGDLGF